MTEIILSVSVFMLAFLGLGVGVIFGKRTPLKGSCGSVSTTSLGGVNVENSCCTCSCSNNHNEKSNKTKESRTTNHKFVKLIIK